MKLRLANCHVHVPWYYSCLLVNEEILLFVTGVNAIRWKLGMSFISTIRTSVSANQDYSSSPGWDHEDLLCSCRNSTPKSDTCSTRSDSLLRLLEAFALNSCKTS